jgi:hypothetical protein
MKNYIVLAVTACSIIFLTSFNPVPEWTSLLDSQLSQWRIYQSYRMADDYKGTLPVDASGKTPAPIGYDKNEANVFSVEMQNGEPVLHITGEIYGCVFTKQSFTDYDFKLQVKWGNKKWVPRLNKPKDSGILYDSQGECGVDYWHTWMMGQEFQVSEPADGNAMGDYWCQATSGAFVHARANDSNNILVFDTTAAVKQMGNGKPNFCQAMQAYEAPGDEWTTLELINIKGRSVHIVNGHVVMALSNSHYIKDGKELPLNEGKIQLQSEAAEVFYKNIQIKPLTVMPAAYAGYFK